MLFSFSILYSVPLVDHLIKHLVTVCRSNSCETKAQSVPNSFFLFTLGSIWFHTEQIFLIGSSHSHRFSCGYRSPTYLRLKPFCKGQLCKRKDWRFTNVDTHLFCMGPVVKWVTGVGCRWVYRRVQRLLFVLRVDASLGHSLHPRPASILVYPDSSLQLVIKSQGWVNADGCVSVCATDMWPLCTRTGHRHVGSVCVCMAGPGSKACCALAPMGHGNGGWGVGPPTATRW